MAAPRLETDRLLLREWQESDLAPFAAMNADPEVMRYFPGEQTAEESARLMAAANTSLANRRFGLWAVERKDAGTFIGFIGLAVPGFEAPFMPCTEIGWRLARAAWGNGFATEGARRVLRYAFEEIGLLEVVSFTAVMNTPSIAVMERLGMRHNPRDDFDHPRIEAGDPLRRHVLYRIRK